MCLPQIEGVLHRGAASFDYIVSHRTIPVVLADRISNSQLGLAVLMMLVGFDDVVREKPSGLALIGSKGLVFEKVAFQTQ